MYCSDLDGDDYDGQWKDDEKNGLGTFYYFVDNRKEEGRWKDDKMIEVDSGEPSTTTERKHDESMINKDGIYYY